MPDGETIIGEPFVGAIIAEVIEKAGLHPCGFRVGMDVAQRIQGAAMVGVGEACAVVALLPKVAAAIEHAVEAHRRVPVEPVHDFGQIFRLCRFNQVMDVIAHDAQGIELKAIFLLAFMDGIEKDFAALTSRKAELSIVAADGDVVAVARFQIAGLTRHGNRCSTCEALYQLGQALELELPPPLTSLLN